MKSRLFLMGMCALSASLAGCGSGSTSGDASAGAQAGDTAVAAPDSLTLALAGDIMMGTTFPETPTGAYLPADDGAHLFDDVKELFRSADIAAANQEGVLMEPGGQVHESAPAAICFSFRVPPKYVKNLVDAGIDFMSVANNHVNDFHEAGVDATHRTLREAGIAYAGYRGKCPTAVVERSGRKIGFAAFGHTSGTLSIMDYDEVKRTVAGLDSICDYVVVSFHGGGEGEGYTHVPHREETFFNGQRRGDVERFAHTAIDAGADIVYGHGPHVPRAVELYKGHLIMYSLGNFCTTYRMGLGGACGYAPLVTATINSDGTLRHGRIHSFIQQRGVGPKADPTGRVAAFMRSLTLADFPDTPLRIHDDGTLEPIRR